MQAVATPSHSRAAEGRFDVVVVGAGAAGMMCAAVAGQRGRRVLLIEHYHIVGEKIRISGGGRCNFTNVHAGPANYLSQNPDFCRSALARYTPAHFIALVEKHGIAHHEKKLGQQFCDNSSREIIAVDQTTGWGTFESFELFTGHVQGCGDGSFTMRGSISRCRSEVREAVGLRR